MTATARLRHVDRMVAGLRRGWAALARVGGAAGGRGARPVRANRADIAVMAEAVRRIRAGLVAGAPVAVAWWTAEVTLLESYLAILPGLLNLQPGRGTR